MMAMQQMVIFRVGIEEYAIPIEMVKEIILYRGATRLPGTAEYIDGMINLRGKVLMVIDLAKKLALRSGHPAEQHQALIVETGGQEVGLLVDVVTEVMQLEEEDIEPAAGIVPAGGYIRAIGKADQRLLIIMDLPKLFTDSEIAELRKEHAEQSVAG